jgi:hypothetical protein
MFVTLIAIFCNVLSGPRLCVEELITDSSLSDITFQSCQIQGQIGISKWMAESVTYRAHWTLERYRCLPGHYEVRGRI